jgi:LuxR family maltose regulon positive regulatory protein
LSRRHDDREVLIRAILDALGAEEREAFCTYDRRDWVELLERVLPEAAEWAPDRAVDERTPATSLVLDGAELLTDPDAVAALTELLDYGPPTLRVVIATRQRCPAWIAGSRPHGGLTTIRACDLRLTDSEAAELAGKSSPDMHGWALGLALRAQNDPVSAEEAIGDYLRGEVMHGVTTEMRHILRILSVCGPLEPRKAHHLTGNPASGRLLAQFAATTQFATLTETRVVCLHPVLERHLRHEFAAEDWPGFLEVLRLHADWAADEGDLVEAISGYIDLHLDAEAEKVILAHWERAVLSGHADVVESSLRLLHPDRLGARGPLAMVRAMASLATGAVSDWQRWSAIAADRSEPDTRLDANITVRDAIAVSARLACALTNEPVPPASPSSGLTGPWRAMSEVAEGLVHLWEGRVIDAAAQFREAEVACRVSGDQLALVHALAGGALAAAHLRSPTAVIAADEAIAVADQLTTPSRWVVANAYLALAEVHHHADNFAATETAATAALESLSTLSAALEPQTRRRARELLASARRRRPVHTSLPIRRRPPEDSAPQPAVHHPDTTTTALTDREQRVLRALCGPLTLREIADELFVSHNTVKTQVNSIFKKLGVHDRAAAVAAARSNALVPASPRRHAMPRSWNHPAG